MIYRFRIILNAQEDVFRDLEMDNNATLEDFHNSITQAFGFEGQEMASFYVSNDQWEQGEEFVDAGIGTDAQQRIKGYVSQAIDDGCTCRSTRT